VIANEAAIIGPRNSSAEEGGSSAAIYVVAPRAHPGSWFSVVVKAAAQTH
tara:strand:+ start:225 stop:374 length:150 start_codon:yes stop_codon:yes gene_type:complete